MSKIRKTTTLFESKKLILQRIEITIGDCKTTYYREVIIGDDLIVNDIKCIPDWYLRDEKIKALLNE